MDILKHRQFGDTLTSYDLIKSLAIVLMMIDHVGAYFFPDDDLWRIIGRLCVPIWFFLIGYSPSRAIPKDWVIGALVLVGTTWIFEDRVFALHILVTMILLRLTLDFFAPLFLKNMPCFLIGAVACAALAFFTAGYVEYGTLAIPLAMYGLVMRTGGGMPGHALVTLLVFVVTQIIMFGFTVGDSYVFMALAPLSFWLCYRFKPRVFSINLPDFLRFPLQLAGRRTLEIYVIHLALLQALAYLLFSP